MNATTATWTTDKDQYGRTRHSLHVANAMGRVVGVVVKLPETATEAGMLPYLSNDWGTRGAEAVRYHDTLAAAKMRIEALVK